MEKIHHTVRGTILLVIDFFYPLFRRVFSLQTFRYAACGGANTVLDITLFAISYNFIIKKHIVHLGFVTISPHIATLLLSLCITLPSGFYLNRYVVFQQSGLKAHKQLMRYLLVVGICILLNYIFLKIFVDQLGWYPTVAKAVTNIIVILFSYTSQTFFFFKQRPAKHES